MDPITIFLLVAGVVAAVAGGVSQYAATKSTNKVNQQNYEDWKEYNTPVNQMQRLQEAGLNPYMVNGVSNTLSEPYNVQNNTGIASLFNGLSQASMQGLSGYNKSQQVDINRKNLGLNSIMTNARYKLAMQDLKNKNYVGAILASQGSIESLNARAAQELFQDKIDNYRRQNELLMENLTYTKNVNPLKLNFYSQYYPEFINNLKARTEYTTNASKSLTYNRWFQKWALEQQIAQQIAERQQRYNIFLKQHYGGPNLGWFNAGEQSALGWASQGLRQDYYNLAVDKWLTGLGMDAITLGLNPFK